MVSLVREGNADLKLLLTKGAMNFWPKAEHYNKSAWDEFQSLILNDTSVGDTEGEDRRVQLLRKLPKNNFSRMYYTKTFLIN